MAQLFELQYIGSQKAFFSPNGIRCVKEYLRLLLSLWSYFDPFVIYGRPGLNLNQTLV